jgi:hypothetical protein
MKRETWLRGSLIINFLLAALVIWLVTHRTNPALPAQPIDTAKSLAPEEHKAVHPAASTKAAPAGEIGNTWTNWIDALRSVGVPNKVMARLVLADFDDRWQKRMDELQKKFQRGDLDPDALIAASAERQTEQDRELRAALGEQGFRLWDEENTLLSLNVRNITLSASETNALYDLQKQFEQQTHDLEQKRQKGEIDDTDCNERMSQLQSAFDQQVEALLGKDRFASMKGADDDGSGELRRNLRKLNATDTQFESMLEAQRQWTERRAELDLQLQQNQSIGNAYEQKIQDIDAARDQEYQRVLGTNAFDNFQMEQDNRYLQMKRYSSAWGIDDNNIDYIYRTIKYYEQSVQNYRQQAQQLEQSGQAVDWNAINNNLDQFSQQTQQALRDYLGVDRFNKINRNQVLPFGQK